MENEIISNRQIDLKNEKEIADYMDENFYAKYTTNFKRYSDRNTQLLGIDTTCDIANRKNMLIDEKAMMYYINKDIPTFAFELSFNLYGDRRVDGWFLDEKKLTQFYFMIWVNAINDDLTNFKKEDITNLEVIVIERKRLIKWLDSEGFSIEKIMEYNDRIVKDNLVGKTYTKNNNKNFHFQYSNSLREKPVNIIIKKSVLKDISAGQKILYNFNMYKEEPKKIIEPRFRNELMDDILEN